MNYLEQITSSQSLVGGLIITFIIVMLFEYLRSKRKAEYLRRCEKAKQWKYASTSSNNAHTLGTPVGEGWELVTVLKDSKNSLFVAYFKRKV